MMSYLFFGITFAFAAAVQPGPLQAYLVTQALAVGWRQTILAAFSPLLSDGPIIILTLLVLSHVPSQYVQGLQIFGGGFLLYLALNAYKTYRSYDPERAIQRQSRHQTLFKAALINLLNPNPYLGWSLVMGPLLLRGWQEDPRYGIALIVGFYATMVICLLGTIILFSFARNIGTKVNRLLLGGSVIALVGFGFYELWTGIKVLIGA